MASDDKTEEPSQRRKDEARKKGQVPKSQELNTVVVLFVAFYTLRLYAETMYWQFERVFRNGLDDVGHLAFDPLSVVHHGTAQLYHMLLILAPFLAILFGAAMFVNFLQVGFMLSGQGLMPNFSKLNPAQGLQRMFSKQGVVQAVKSIANIVVVLWTLKSYLTAEGLAILTMERMEPIAALATLARMAWDIAFRITMVLLVIALLDFMYQRWQNHQNLKMTKQEVKDEFKQQEGDPHVKSRIRSKMREMARKRMMSSVPEAHVVVTNPLHVAVALQYDFDTMETPLLVAKGKGFVADRIRELARSCAIPIIENRDVARALYDHCEIGGDIPPHLYQAVAEIIAYLYQRKFAHLFAASAETPAAGPVRELPALGGSATERLDAAAALTAAEFQKSRRVAGSRAMDDEESSSAGEGRTA